jgi:tetratricopeptide (TPR) repeat protein
MTTVWEEFGVAVAKARAAKKWTLAAVAELAFKSPDRKGYVSQIEKGRTKLHFSTVKKLAETLGLPESVTDPVFRADLPAEDDVDKVDRDAERLLRLTTRDETGPPAAEALLISLAYEFARGSHAEIITAYNGLRAALKAAAEIDAQGALPQNTGDQMQAILRCVSDLNDQGLKEEAGNAVEEAIRRNDAEAEALLDLALKQDRVRNNPEATAKKLISRLNANTPPEKLSAGIRKLVHEWYTLGFDKGVIFDIEVSVILSRHALSLSYINNRAAAYFDLGLCLYGLGRYEATGSKLNEAVNIFKIVINETSRQHDTENWALTQNYLGEVLREIGFRESGTRTLYKALAALREAKKAYATLPKTRGWATVHSDIGKTLMDIGGRDNDRTKLVLAIEAFDEALKYRSPVDSLEDWIATMSNKAGAQLTLGDRDKDANCVLAAIKTFEALQSFPTRAHKPKSWATTENNLGFGLHILGTLELGTDRFDEAYKAYENCLLEVTLDQMPYQWARTILNLADLDTSYFSKTGDAARIKSAQERAITARTIFAQAGTSHQVSECDTLLTKIANLTSKI